MNRDTLSYCVYIWIALPRLLSQVHHRCDAQFYVQYPLQYREPGPQQSRTPRNVSQRNIRGSVRGDFYMARFDKIVAHLTHFDIYLY